MYEEPPRTLLEPPRTFDEIFKVTSAPFFIHNLNLIRCKLDNFSLKSYVESFYIKAKNKTNIPVPCEKSKAVSLLLQHNEKYCCLLF